MSIVINRRKKQNVFRQGCVTEKGNIFALRLKRREVYELALEYMRRNSAYKLEAHVFLYMIV